MRKFVLSVVAGLSFVVVAAGGGNTGPTGSGFADSSGHNNGAVSASKITVDNGVQNNTAVVSQIQEVAAPAPNVAFNAIDLTAQAPAVDPRDFVVINVENSVAIGNNNGEPQDEAAGAVIATGDQGATGNVGFTNVVT